MASVKKGISYKTGFKALKKMISDKLDNEHQFATKKERKDAVKDIIKETMSAFENGISDYLDSNIDKSIHKFSLINKEETKANSRENKKGKPRDEPINKISSKKKVETKANSRENKKIKPINAPNTMTIRIELFKQITGALKGAKFPIKTGEQLLKSFPNGANTKCKADGVEMTAGEADKLLKPSDFPFKSAGHVANTILERVGL